MATTDQANLPDYEWAIQPQRSLFDLRLGELWKYRDLVMLFVRRDFVSVYKQTILGPLWYLIQPLLTTIIFTFIFGQVASLPDQDQRNLREQCKSVWQGLLPAPGCAGLHSHFQPDHLYYPADALRALLFAARIYYPAQLVDPVRALPGVDDGRSRPGIRYPQLFPDYQVP